MALDWGAQGSYDGQYYTPGNLYDQYHHADVAQHVAQPAWLTNAVNDRLNALEQKVGSIELHLQQNANALEQKVGSIERHLQQYATEIVRIQEASHTTFLKLSKENEQKLEQTKHNLEVYWKGREQKFVEQTKNTLEVSWIGREQTFVKTMNEALAQAVAAVRREGTEKVLAVEQECQSLRAALDQRSIAVQRKFAATQASFDSLKQYVHSFVVDRRSTAEANRPSQPVDEPNSGWQTPVPTTRGTSATHAPPPSPPAQLRVTSRMLFRGGANAMNPQIVSGGSSRGFQNLAGTAFARLRSCQHSLRSGMLPSTSIGGVTAMAAE